MRTDFDFRRTITTLVFCGAGLALTPLLAWMTYLVRSDAPIVGRLAMGTICLLGIVLIGLSFTVAMRQISGKWGAAEFSAEGGDAPPAAKITTTTETTVAPAGGVE
jgi:FtsH-binding integral membrane protein